MLVANDEYSDSCTDTADIGSYDSTIGDAHAGADGSAHQCADSRTYSLAYTSTNAADASTYCRANSCAQPVSDKPAHSSAYNSQIRSRAALSVQAVERKHHDRLLELSEQLDQGNAFVELDSHHRRSE